MFETNVMFFFIKKTVIKIKINQSKFNLQTFVIVIDEIIIIGDNDIITNANFQP